MTFETVVEGRRYVLRDPEHGLELTADRLEWRGPELHGELGLVAGTLGGRHYDGPVTAATFNFSSAQTRSQRAKYLRELTKTSDVVDWAGLIEEICRQVINAQRRGTPSIDLRTAPLPPADDTRWVQGLAIPLRHPSMLYGDGATLKTYFALWIGGSLSRAGLRVLMADWELEAGDHRERLEALFGLDMPHIEYVRCEQPMTAAIDSLSRTVVDKRIDYVICDSVGFAADGPPESAEVALRYLSAVRQLRIGSLHLAHCVKDRDDARLGPFGSRFWFNGVRRVYHSELLDSEGDVQRVKFTTRKTLKGRPPAPLTFAVDFSNGRTTIRPCDTPLYEAPSPQLRVKDQIREALADGPMTYATIAQRIGRNVNTVVQTVNREIEKGSRGMFEMAWIAKLESLIAAALRIDAALGLDRRTRDMGSLTPADVVARAEQERA